MLRIIPAKPDIRMFSAMSLMISTVAPRVSIRSNWPFFISGRGPAAIMSNCDEMIRNLPSRYDTVLTQSGQNISQGQKQLLTIARAFVAQPKILILDEATSSVDTRTEKKIQDAMVKLMHNRTSLIIAHRLSTIRDADMIVVMDKGHIVETGKHEELLKAKGKYYDLYMTQFEGKNT